MMDHLPNMQDNRPAGFDFKDPMEMAAGDLIFEEDKTKWPVMNIPFDGEATFTVNYYDWEARRLETFKDMKITKYIDSTGNRALSMFSMNDPLRGGIRKSNSFFNFNQQHVVMSDPDNTKQCFQLDLPEAFNLHDYIDRLKKEEGGLAVYLGVKTLRWGINDDDTKGKLYYAFRLDENWFDQEVRKIVYFDWDTKELAWIEVVKPFFFVMKVENGIKKRKFTDEDYKDVLTECPRKPSLASFFSNKKN
eukprot:403347365